MAKRVSTDEKLTKIVQFFKTTADIYSIKELEKKLQKECNISSMLVPDLLKKLIEENMISSDKCGVANMFYCFEYQEHHNLQCETEKAQLSIEQYREEVESKRTKLQEFKEVEESEPEREGIVREYNKLKEKYNKLEAQQKQDGECSLEEYNSLQKETDECKQKVNKITDDVFSIQGYMATKFSIARTDFYKNFGFDVDMDYVV